MTAFSLGTLTTSLRLCSPLGTHDMITTASSKLLSFFSHRCIMSEPLQRARILRIRSVTIATEEDLST